MANTPTFENTNPGQVDWVLEKTLQPEDDVLKSVRQYCRDMGLPDIEVSAEQGKFLELLVRTANARKVLEIGTLGGYSTICLARGAGRHGQVTSLEYEAKHASVARANLESAGLAYMVEVHTGDAHALLPALAAEIEREERSPYDFVFIDADKESNLDYFKWADKVGGYDVTIVVDNVIRDGRVLDPKRADKFEFIQFLGDRRDFEVSVVQTVGSKGWDGFVLAKRK